MRVSNKNTRGLVKERKVFTGNNTFAKVWNNVYVVYSYGVHFPMYMYISETNTWYENSRKYSVSTSKQQSQLRPLGAEIILKDTQELQNLINKSIYGRD
jgi:sulfatase maturation enzyme AslB (radical SAM superfamily)